jgi:uncharacterized coiled-coil protein SlyX
LPRKFCFASSFLRCHPCSDRLFVSQALALLEKQCEKRVTKSAQVAKITKLEVMVRSQADRIAELEGTCADFKREKDKVTNGYRSLVEKHKSLDEAGHDKTKLAKAHAAKLTKLRSDMDLETHSYTEYVQTMLHRLHGKGVKVEEMIDWVDGEVKVVLDTVW